MINKLNINISKRFLIFFILLSIGASVECWILVKNPIYEDFKTSCNVSNINNITYPPYNDKCIALRFDTCYYDENECKSIEINYPRYRKNECFDLVNIINELNTIHNQSTFTCYINGHYGYIEKYDNLESTKYMIISWAMVGVAFSCFIIYGACEYCHKKENNYVRI